MKCEYRLTVQHKLILLLAALFLLLCEAAAVTPPPAGTHRDRKDILLLNSYHPGYKWSDEIQQGVLEILRPLSSTVNIHIEYMDMKRNYSEERFAALSRSVAEKYRDIAIEYVVSFDDAAFSFIKSYHDSLFPGAPVVFCGTNYLELNDLTGLDEFYGITEKADIGLTFDLMLKLHPDTKNIYVINDRTISGRKVGPSIETAANNYPEVTFSYLNDLAMDEILRKVADLPENSLIFYTFFLRDAEGAVFEYDESISLIAGASSVPIYGAWDFNLGLGIVGGMLTSGYHQGKAAGQLVSEFIKDTRTPPSPQLSESPNRYMFDYSVLERYKIPIRLLPAGSIIINKPETFVERHRKVLLFSMVFITILLVIIAFLGRNILLRKRTEMKLQQSERNFRGIFEHAIEGLFQASLDGSFHQVNSSLAQMLKCLSPEETILHYRNLKADLFVNSDQYSHMVKQVLEGGSAQLEASLRCRDGSSITALLFCRNVIDGKGDHLYLEGSITDMTEYKMTQEIIIQTEKMLTLGGLSAGIAHEIKNPLTSMMQASTIISNRLVQDTTRNKEYAEQAGISLDGLTSYMESRDIPQLLANIIESGNRANVIVEDMLSFSKKSIGEFAFEPLPEIVAESVELARKDYTLRREYRFKAILIRYDYAEHVPPLYCSRSKLCQVIFNILKNSAEAMAEASTPDPEIVCRIEYDSDSIRLQISDNGPGMDAKVSEKIFEPFYSTKGKKKGTGLGLSIAYFIITENHKGRMSVQSEPGQGAIFLMEFPRKDKTAKIKPPAET